MTDHRCSEIDIDDSAQVDDDRKWIFLSQTDDFRFLQSSSLEIGSRFLVGILHLEKKNDLNVESNYIKKLTNNSNRKMIRDSTTKLVNKMK